MWIHVVIFLLLIGVVVLWRLGWIPRDELADKKSRQMFVLLVLAGNLLGLSLTYKDLDRSLGEEAKLPRKGSTYEEELVLTVEGEDPLLMPVKVPMREEEEVEEEKEEMDEEEIQRKELSQSILAYNEEKGDEGYYYLPSEWDGKGLSWERPRDNSGSLLAALFLVAAAATLLLKRREKEAAKEKRAQSMLMDYPEVIMRFCLLVQSGMTVRNVFAKMGDDYQRKRGEEVRPVYEEILTTCYEIEAGVSELEAYHRFGERCSQVKYKTFATLLIQNLQKGSRQLTAMLEKESQEAWEDRKRRARVMGEEAATRLLFPMILMMVCVMIIVMVPALLSFYGT